MSDEIFTGDIATATVAEAKDWLRLRAGKGARCPCCKQYVKIYKRPLGSQMARWLIWLVRTWEWQLRLPAGNRNSQGHGINYHWLPGAWVDIKGSPVRGGDYAKLIHWGLVEQKPHVPGKKNGSPSRDTRDSGMWRPTFKGLDFVYRRTMVPSHVLLYDNIKLGEELHLISIEDALGKKHSYTELMNASVSVGVPV